LALLVLLATASVWAADHEFKASQQPGSLVLDIPSEWTESTVKRERTPSTTTIETGDGELKFTLLWNAKQDPKFNSAEQLKASLEASSGDFLALAVESSLELEPLAGPGVTGFYCSLSRLELAGVSELGPGQYRDFTPGIFAVGDYQVFFTMTSKEENSKDRLRVLEMFRNARFQAASPPQDETAPDEPSDLE
jgi:hypothetical protein